MTYTEADFANNIKERLPGCSVVHDEESLLAILIDDSIGVELSNIESWLFANSDARFIVRAVGTHLNRYGSWFGIPRQSGESDADYLNRLISFRGSDITITGLKKSISTILDIDKDDIVITNSYPNYVSAGDDVTANYLTGIPGKFSGYVNPLSKTLTIQIPSGSDLDHILLDLIENMILPGVTVDIDDNNLVSLNVATGTDYLGDTTGFIASIGTVESDTARYYKGSRSLKVTTNGKWSGVATLVTTEEDLDYIFKTRLYVPTGQTVSLEVLNGSAEAIGAPIPYEGEGDWIDATLEWTNPADDTVAALVAYTDSEDVFDFNLDSINCYEV